MSSISEEKFEEKWHLPEKFRIETERSTEVQKKLLAASDAKQQEWAESSAAPFAQTSPKMRARARAVILKEEYLAIGIENLIDIQREELAAAYATLGRFDLAAILAPTGELAAAYAEIWSCIWRDDSLWCGHPEKAQYVQLDLYSIKHESDAVLVRCNTCGTRNAVLTPEHIETARRARASMIQNFSGLKPLEAKAQLESNL